MSDTMLGAVLPGNSTVELHEFPIPDRATARSWSG